MLNRMTLKQACELIELINNRGVEAHFGWNVDHVGIIYDEYLEVLNGNPNC